MDNQEENQEVLNPLAENTRRVLKARRWSNRQAQIASGIHYSTIQQMRHGVRPSAETLAKWATAIREDVDAWLSYAGYRSVNTSVVAVPVSVPVEPGVVHYVPIFEDLIEAGFDELPPEERDEITEIIKLKLAKHRRRQTNFGKRAE